MSELRKANYDALFFLTITVVGWIDVFSRKQYADILLKNLQFCQQHKGLEIYGYVIMTNHFHLLAAQSGGNLQKTMQHFKSFTAKEILKAIETNDVESRKDWLLHMFRFHAKLRKSYDEYHFWQQDNHPTECYNREMSLQKLNYMHMNPVKAGFVGEPEHWLYSSAHPMSFLHILAL